MKKILALIIFICVFAPAAFGQTNGMLNLNRYASYFLHSNGRLDRPYLRAATEDYFNRIATLGGSETSVDTPLEIALLSITPGVAEIRPAEANRMLGTPRQADLKLGAAVFQEIQVLRFLADTAAVSRHEAMLQWIISRGNVTRAEVEAFYRNGIRGLISEAVNEEFNKVSFFIENIIGQRANSFNGVLTRNPQNGHYTLRYEDARNITRELTGQTLEALLSALSRSGEFSQDAINIVRTQAALMPAVVLSNTALTEITNIITRFYTEPNQSTYAAVLEAYSVIGQALPSTRDIRYSHVSDSYARVLFALNRDFAQRVFTDSRTLRSITILTREQQRRLVELR